MLQLTIIGNLGADAEVKNSNGHQFVSFRVAHTESYNDSQGVKQERTQWVSCALNGDGGGLLPYLVKGTLVCVVGSLTVGIASSQKLRSMVATCNVHVRSIELLSRGQSDEVPRQLFTEKGLLLDTVKMYTLSKENFDSLQVGDAGINLYDRHGVAFLLSKNGLITPAQ